MQRPLGTSLRIGTAMTADCTDAVGWRQRVLRTPLATGRSYGLDPPLVMPVVAARAVVPKKTSRLVARSTLAAHGAIRSICLIRSIPFPPLCLTAVPSGCLRASPATSVRASRSRTASLASARERHAEDADRSHTAAPVGHEDQRHWIAPPRRIRRLRAKGIEAHRLERLCRAVHDRGGERAIREGH